jgi:two-component system, LuxR family, sensor kinase FixL
MTVAQFRLTGIAFLALYFASNKLAPFHQFQGLEITLWSPDSGLALLLLAETTAFAPFVFFGAVLTVVCIFGVHPGLPARIGAELVVTLCYVVLAALLRQQLKLGSRGVRLADIVLLITFIAVGMALTAFCYCGVLFLAGVLPASRFYAAMRHFWIGHTVGMITVIPAATSLLAVTSKARWFWSRYSLITYSLFILGTCVAFAILFGDGDAKENHFFILLFLPIIWLGIRGGYAEIAVALLVIQLGLVAMTTYLGYDARYFGLFQMMMLALSTTGLLFGGMVSERNRATRLLREQQAELARMSAYAAAGAMAMTLAHEISQPLSTVTTYVHAARRMLRSGAASAPVIDVLRKAEVEAKRTREVLDRVRDFVSTGRMELHPVDLSRLGLKIGSLRREDAAARGVHIEVELNHPIPFVKADKIQIEQVLNNLVANAIDAASERRDSLGNVIIRIASQVDRVVVQVEDNGPGVAPEIVDSLFEAYQTTKTRGMGLGLPLSLQIVQKHAGRLWWEPIVPRGTRFVVELQVDGPDQNAV